VVKKALDMAQILEKYKLAEEDLKLMLEDAKAVSESLKSGDADKMIH
jgi:hypothetical protein